MGLSDLDDLSAGHAHQVGRSQAKDGIGCAGSRPYLRVLEQVFIHEGQQLFGMAYRRHTADGEAGMLADEVGVAMPEPLPADASL